VKHLLFIYTYAVQSERLKPQAFEQPCDSS